MIYKLLMILFSTFSHVFANIAVTDQNSHCSFDIRQVKYIGKIEIDSLFIDYVLEKNYSCLCFKRHFTGKDIQENLLNYIQDKVFEKTKDNTESTKSEVYQVIYKLIHNEITGKEANIKISPLILSLINDQCYCDECCCGESKS